MALTTPSENDDEAVEEWIDLITEAVGAAGETGFMPLLVQGATALGGGSGSFLKKYGAEFGASSPQLHAEFLGAVMGACGVPPLLLSRQLGGSAFRDAWRSFLASAAEPVADQLAQAASTLFGVDIAISVVGTHSHTTPADVVSRSRAVGSLVTAGVDIERALNLAGFA